ncbi:MAG: alpha/beta fold hydrolase [Nitrospinota bacterium]
MAYIRCKDGVNIYYEIEGEGRPILFLHGWSMSSSVWRYQKEDLSREFKVITLDLRGHGQSDKPGQEYNFDIFADDLNHVINTLALSDLTIVGWSMASFILVRFFLRYPGQISALVFVGGTPKFVADKAYRHGQPIGTVTRLEQNLRRDYDNYIRDFCSRLFISDEDIDEERSKEIWDLLFDERFPPPDYVSISTLKAIAREDIRDSLAMINLPTLILHGSLDKICPPGAAGYMAKNIPGAKKIILNGLGHAPFLTQPGVFNKCIKKFMEGAPFSPLKCSEILQNK